MSIFHMFVPQAVLRNKTSILTFFLSLSQDSYGHIKDQRIHAPENFAVSSYNIGHCS